MNAEKKAKYFEYAAIQIISNNENFRSVSMQDVVMLRNLKLFGEMNLKELACSQDMPSATRHIYKNVEKFIELGLVKKIRVGRQSLCTLTKKCSELFDTIIKEEA